MRRNLETRLRTIEAQAPAHRETVRLQVVYTDWATGEKDVWPGYVYTRLPGGAWEREDADASDVSASPGPA